MLCQVKLMIPYLAHTSIAFVGDHDCTSLLLGMLTQLEPESRPKQMLILDFDERLLALARNFAKIHGFGDIVEVALYNVFDPLPASLTGQFDWFYTNPPYGCSNNGESARLFICRGCELVKSHDAKACIILPHDRVRTWTRTAMLATQSFLCNFGWTIDEKLNAMHRYHLDDDHELASSVIIAKQDPDISNATETMPYVGRRVQFEEIPHFYGKGTPKPYPRYIRLSDEYDYKW